MKLDLTTWKGADQFRFFRTFERPHFAVTARVDVTRMMAAKARDGLSPFRTTLWVIGAGLHAVDEMRLRFRGEDVTLHERVDMSPTIALHDGDFRFAYIVWNADRLAFDAHAAEEIARVRGTRLHNPNDPTVNDAVVYMSCLPWLDFTSLDNAMPDAEDCIPRLGWGKIVDHGDRQDMAMSVQVHHAVVAGRPVGQFFEAVQDALNSL